MKSLRNPNHLSKESSPYLQQHADNAVDWYPWGEEALLLARQENKPIFLSVGYSSCHWCHVMREESFEDEKVGKLLNDFFIPIKVDREERPDIDHLYMNFAQAMTGRGGWPLNVFLTPEEKPFYAMTYLPKESQGENLGLKELLLQIHELWENDLVRIKTSADYLLNAVSKTLEGQDVDGGKIDLSEKAFIDLQASFDESYGGFHQGQKFPLPHHLLFLLRYHHKTKNEIALSMVKKTLDAMYRGGIFDHLGHGFSRYTVDERWQIPHFEKMLYDNALMLRVYAEAYRVTKEPIYQEVSEKIIAYIHGEMTSDQGTFYSSQDADSEGEEGKFYLFTYDEILGVLGEDKGVEFAKYYGATKAGNFEGKNILHLEKESLEDKTKTFQESKEKMLTYRNLRVHPSTDKKILTSWNGLMIGALAYGGMGFNEENYVDRAKNALDSILKTHFVNGDLYASSYDGVIGPKAFLESYAYLLYGILSLQEATLDPEYIKLAIDLEHEMSLKFWDDKNFGYFLRSLEEPELIMKVKDLYDTALPSGNAMAAWALQKLWSLTGDRKYEVKLKLMMKAFGGKISEQTLGFTGVLLSYDMVQAGPSQISLIGNQEDQVIREMIHVIQTTYLPEYTTTRQSKVDKEGDDSLYTIERASLEGKSTALICRNHACLEEILDAITLKEILNERMRDG